jgi:polysaccharide biosynthesis protein PelC
MTRMLTIKRLLAICLLLLGTGCSLSNDLMTRFVSKKSPQEVCRVAVLPFENQTGNLGAATLAYRVFYSELIAAEMVDIVPEGDVRLFLLRNRLRPGPVLTADHFEDLAKYLEVDAVVTGTLVDVGMESRSGGESVPFVALQLDMYDVQDGYWILNTFHRRWGDDYRKALHLGVVRTLSGVVTHVAGEILEDWKNKGVGDCKR